LSKPLKERSSYVKELFKNAKKGTIFHPFAVRHRLTAFKHVLIAFCTPVVGAKNSWGFAAGSTPHLV
jgi:hypothetical protein